MTGSGLACRGRKSGEQKKQLSPDHVFREKINTSVIAVILAGGPGAIGDPLANARSLGALEVVRLLSAYH
jgi:hypothetical protein